jgi:hypothetical protein
MKLNIVAKSGFVSIDTLEKDAPASFSFAFNKGMYRESDGVGCQVNTPAMQADIEQLGCQVAEAILAFGAKYPQLGIAENFITLDR